MVGRELGRLLVLVLREDGRVLHGYLCRVEGKDLGERGYSSTGHGLDWLGRLSEGVCEVGGDGDASEDRLEIKDGGLLLLLRVLLAEVIGFLEVGGVRHGTSLVRVEREIGPEIKLLGEISVLLAGEQITAIVRRLWGLDDVQPIQVCRRHVDRGEEDGNSHRVELRSLRYIILTKHSVRHPHAHESS